MSNIELQSFLTKFYQLKNAGYSAHLDLHAHSGQCWVGLRAQLGQAGQQPPQHRHHQQRPRLRRSPAYARRKERRQAARQAQAAAADSDAPAAEVGANEENGNIVTEEVAEVSAENAATAEEVEEGMDSSTPLVETTESSPPPDEVTQGWYSRI